MKKLVAMVLALCLLCGCAAKTEPSTAPTYSEITTNTTIPNPPEDENVRIECTEGTDDCWEITEDKIIFSDLNADTVCTISGRFNGSIEVKAGEYKLELELNGATIYSQNESPIVVSSGDEVILTAKKETQNFIYDTREAVNSEDETQYAAAVYSLADLVVGGKGELTIASEHNKGIHTKDDLTVRNLTLSVSCTDNALKGNDSVEIIGGNVTLIATEGDGIKTSSTDVSSKGKQRGTVTLSGCKLDIAAARDGIDAAYDVVIEENTVLNIQTDRYSQYTAETIENAVGEKVDSPEDLPWENMQPPEGGQPPEGMPNDMQPPEGGQPPEGMPNDMQPPEGGQPPEEMPNDMQPPEGMERPEKPDGEHFDHGEDWDKGEHRRDFDDFGGFGGRGSKGGFADGNADKADYSCKGIKAGNQITINGGEMQITAYDDAIHANSDSELENGEEALGSVTINDGNLTLFSNDDGIHADSEATINGGSITISGCYEGIEGTTVTLNGGNVSIVSKDDGVNATATEGIGIHITGGRLYVYATGDGIDANSRTDEQGIVIAGGDCVVICNSNANSSLDTERGYTYTGGRVLALSSAGGMSSEATNCSNFSSVATKTTQNLREGDILNVASGEDMVEVKMPCSMQAMVIYLGSADAQMQTQSETTQTLHENGVSWS